MPSSKSGSTGHDPPNSGPDDGEAGPLISNDAAMASDLATHDAEAKRLQAEIELHSSAIQEAHCKMLSSQSLSKAYQNLEKNKKKQKTAKSRSSHQRRPHQPISGDVCNLVERSIFDQNKKQTEVAKDFQISDRQITSDILVSILLHLEEDPKSTLSDLAKLSSSAFPGPPPTSSQPLRPTHHTSQPAVNFPLNNNIDLTVSNSSDNNTPAPNKLPFHCN
ncbi:hypothetical protein PtA15_10A335 [Puccinia triticina]|uniref:HTH psq-type domain-containing protein n=1 Tax=Puccinia triticina TaxID=208348 RepID=A0ABY7CWT2_9BASI|nr:uncharacterized protein PtA15_10A335 [Puccinia triticina]WAQ88912.1 hypothetical protein PtA15_10A335 [Puccinia triticina]